MSRTSFFKWSAILLLIEGSISANAQTKSDTLKEVKVNAQKIFNNNTKIRNYTIGQKILSFDSVTLARFQQQNIAQLIVNNLAVFVKQNTFNGLSTLSFRGSSAAQNCVLWNGVSIQNAANGMSDISLFPVFFFDRLSIILGSNSSLFGSGNIGGAISLENNQFFNKDIASDKIKLWMGLGSFHQYQVGWSNLISKRKYFIETKYMYNYALNDFKGNFNFINSNAKTSNQQFQINTGFNWNPKDVLTFNSWFTFSNREIPPSSFEPFSVKKQADINIRLGLNWKHDFKNSISNFQVAFIEDRMKYKDADVGINSLNLTRNLFVNLNWEKVFNHKLKLYFETPFKFQNLIVSPKKHQNSAALVGALSTNFFKNVVRLSLSCRAEHYLNRNVVLPGLSSEIFLYKNLKIKGSIQKTFRMPTLNELYFMPGGSDSLKPEIGWAEEFGYEFKNKFNGIMLNHQLTYFNRNIDNWIIWFGGSIWTPHNLASVRSRGIETESSLSFPINQFKVDLGFQSSYCLATTVHSELQNDSSIGKQIPYTPRYIWAGNFGLHWKNLNLNYRFSYMGYRFITTDESEFIAPYQLSSLYVSSVFKVRNIILTGSFQCQNLNNVEYEIVKFRPMPKRNFLIGISLSK